LVVEEPLVGIDEDTKQVDLQAGWPKAGERLLVYANRGTDGNLYLGICNGTKVVARSQEDLEYLRSVRDGKAKASISGRVDSGYGSPPIEGAIITAVDAEGHEHQAVTDADGRFVFGNLPQETYILRPHKPGFEARAGGR
jgi:hypothetical protein